MKAVTLPLCTTALLVFAGTALAHERDRTGYDGPPPPSGYGGTVNNFYGPVTINNGTAANYPADYGSAPVYAPDYATAPQWDANSYGAGYDWSGGYGYPAYGYGTSYGYRVSSRPPVYDGARMDPWNGYNGGWNNGY